MKEQRHQVRSGKTLTLLAIAAPVLMGFVGLVVDGGNLASQRRRLQQAVDAAATLAATTLRLEDSPAAAAAAATASITEDNGFATASVVSQIPPVAGPYAGRPGFVEIEAQLTESFVLGRFLNAAGQCAVRARAVAGSADSTAGAAIVVLDPSPAALSAAGATEILAGVDAAALVGQLPLGSLLSGLGLGAYVNATRNAVASQLSGALNDSLSAVALPPLPTLIAGLEVEGLGKLIVDGAIHVNTRWGGLDENQATVGISSPPPYAVACMPVLSTTRVRARDLRVVGGVDSPANYAAFDLGASPPLCANRLPVPDPLANLPVPATATDPDHVTTTVRGGHVVVVHVGSVASIMQPILGVLWPLLQNVVEAALGPVLTPGPLEPGVYDSLTILSLGHVTLNPGVYIIRGQSPITQMPLAIIGGRVTASGVMFYVTDSSSYSASTGAPDAYDDSSSPPTNSLSSALPSALLAPLHPGSTISGLNAPSSPFHGLVLYQRRNNRRPIVLAAHHLAGGGQIKGTVYSKWGHVAFIGGAGAYDLRLVGGTIRVVTAFDTTIAPSELLPAARDVYLVE